MKINFLPVNIKSLSISNLSVMQKLHTFRGADSDADVFEKDAVKLDDNQKRVMNILNSRLDESSNIKFTPEIIKEVATFKESIPMYYKNSGGLLFECLVRKYLTENLAYQNSFTLSLYDKAIKQTSIPNIIEATGVGEYINADNDAQKIRKFNLFLRRLEEATSTEFVYDFLRPHLENQIYSERISFKENLLHSYYNFDSRATGRTYIVDTKRTNGGKFIAESYLDNKKQASVIGNTRAEAKRKLIDETINELNIKAIKYRGIRSVNKRHFMNERVFNQVNTLLRHINFLNEGESLDIIKDNEKIEYIARAITPGIRKEPYCFQELEYYGDGIANYYTCKFLSETITDAAPSAPYFKYLTSNKVFGEISKSLALEKYYNSDGRYHPDKHSADMLEALIGALYLSFPDERVYNFVKNLLKEKLKTATIEEITTH